MTETTVKNGKDTSVEAEVLQAKATIIALQQQLAAKDQEITGLKTDQILKNTYIQQLVEALKKAQQPELPIPAAKKPAPSKRKRA